jgi:hypothetical protein
MRHRLASLTQPIRGALAIALALGACSVAGSIAGCSTHTDNLNRGQRYYDENEYEKALALWRALEVDQDSLSDKERARYAYLRGMTDFRLGYRPYARHWLAIAKAMEKEHPGGLEQDWIHRADEALTDLNKDVYGVERFDSSGAGGAGGDSTGAQGGVGPSNGSGGCLTDSDCSADQVCIAKACVQP